MSQNKYGAALGVWDLMVGRTKEQGPLKLHPKHTDNREFLERIMNPEIKKNPKIMLNTTFDTIKKLIEKEYPPENDEEKEQLIAYLNSNLLELMDELMITFKMTTREEIAVQKKELLQAGRSL